METSIFKFDNILVCLDLTDMDESLINYSNYLVDKFNPKSLTFIHVMDTYEIPEELSDSLSDNHRPLNEIIIEEIQEKIDALYSQGDSLKPSIVLESGITTEKIVQFARKNKTDLALMGKKIGFTGEGGVVKNIIGLIPASVLLISETTPHNISRIMVRTNFAKPSYAAYHMATLISEKTTADIEFHHVYKLPYNYFPEQSAQALLKLKKQLDPYIEKQYNKFVKKYKLPKGIPFEYSVDLKGDEAQSLYSYALRNRVDLLLTGTRLKSQLANVIMDSTSEKLASVEKNIPVLIEKDSKESVGFLEALFD
jgi:nucleotide-binding universal stress UspA family protein